MTTLIFFHYSFSPILFSSKIIFSYKILNYTKYRLELCNDAIFCTLGVAELVAGYMDCMEEALNYLKDVECYPDDHPAIVDLRQHLALYQTQFLRQTIKNSSETSLR